MTDTEPTFQDGPSDLPDPIRVTLPLTGPQVLTLRDALLTARDRARKSLQWGKANHLGAILVTIDHAVSDLPAGMMEKYR